MNFTQKAEFDHGSKALFAGMDFDYKQVFEKHKGNLFGLYRKQYDSIPVDLSLIDIAKQTKRSLSELFEEMDPSHYYRGTPLEKTTAIDRQGMRFGMLPTPQKPGRVGAVKFRSAKFMTANTAASAIIFDEIVRRELYWPEIIDTNYNPDLLLAGTFTQKERTTKAIVIDDSQMAHRRSSDLSENSTPPVSTVGWSGYAGSMRKHGMGIEWSRDFAERTNLNLLFMALNRLGVREQKALFDEIISVIINGDSVYGIDDGATVVTAQSYDPLGVYAAGVLSYWARIKHNFAMRPYNPKIELVNIDTYPAYMSATPPANILNKSILDAIQAFRLPGMDAPQNPQIFGSQPSVIVLPSDRLADNKIITMDPMNGMVRLILAGSEFEDVDYSIPTRMYKRFMWLEDGLFPLASYYDAVQILSLTL